MYICSSDICRLFLESPFRTPTLSFQDTIWMLRKQALRWSLPAKNIGFICHIIDDLAEAHVRRQMRARTMLLFYPSATDNITGVVWTINSLSTPTTISTRTMLLVNSKRHYLWNSLAVIG